MGSTAVRFPQSVVNFKNESSCNHEFIWMSLLQLTGFIQADGFLHLKEPFPHDGPSFIDTEVLPQTCVQTMHRMPWILATGAVVHVLHEINLALLCVNAPTLEIISVHYS